LAFRGGGGNILNYFFALLLLQHFFGGAMGVFTTKTLLNSVGVSKSQAIPGAVAINWILKVRVIVIHFAKSKFFLCHFAFVFLFVIY
jgi:hypothetical protein